jgi:hypothetical protein
MELLSLQSCDENLDILDLEDKGTIKNDTVRFKYYLNLGDLSQNLHLD